MAGYSGTPLVKKLGIKEGFKLYLRNPPVNYMQLIEPVPQNVAIAKRMTPNLDMIHFFVTNKNELTSSLKIFATKIKQNGIIWVSWPKKSSKILSDITENTIRGAALAIGLVDVKVCAVDDIWSGLKLVIRTENRQ
jgi:hypothetical protein